MALIGITTFLPMFVQGVLGRSPVVAGLTLTMYARLADRRDARLPVVPRFGLRPISSPAACSFRWACCSSPC